MARTLSSVFRVLDVRGMLTPARARVLQQAADPTRGAHYKCAHEEYAGAGWSHPWPDEEMFPHACCHAPDHCPAEWAR